MTQLKIPIRRNEFGANRTANSPLQADAVELSYRDDVIVLRFVQDPQWGRTARTVFLERSVADDLTRLLNQELTCLEWPD